MSAFDPKTKHSTSHWMTNDIDGSSNRAVVSQWVENDWLRMSWKRCLRRRGQHWVLIVDLLLPPRLISQYLLLVSDCVKAMFGVIFQPLGHHSAHISFRISVAYSSSVSSCAIYYLIQLSLQVLEFWRQLVLTLVLFHRIAGLSFVVVCVLTCSGLSFSLVCVWLVLGQESS